MISTIKGTTGKIFQYMIFSFVNFANKINLSSASLHQMLYFFLHCFILPASEARKLCDTLQ